MGLAGLLLISRPCGAYNRAVKVTNPGIQNLQKEREREMGGGREREREGGERREKKSHKPRYPEPAEASSVQEFSNLPWCSYGGDLSFSLFSGFL